MPQSSNRVLAQHARGPEFDPEHLQHISHSFEDWAVQDQGVGRKCFILMLLLWAGRGPPSHCASLSDLFFTCVLEGSRNNFYQIRDPFRTSFILKYFHKGSISQHCHTGELGILHMKFGRTQIYSL